MNKEEEEARILCAYCNWVESCDECTLREWPSGQWRKLAAFNWEECQEWRHYLPEFKIPLGIRLKTKLREWLKYWRS